MSNKNPKILILVLCSRNYLSFISSKAQQKIWDKYTKSFDIVHFIGEPYVDKREEDYVLKENSNYLVLNTDDGYPNLAKKTLLAFEYVISNFEFDYLFRTNTSSFVDFNKLQKFVKNNHKNLQYSGSVLDVIEGDTIASGAGFFLSRKNVELLLRESEKFDISLPDDVAIARTLSYFNIFPTNLMRKNLKSVPKPISVYHGEDFHYRCRLDPQFHRILEPLLIKYLNRVSEKTGIVSIVHYYYLFLIFKISNLKFVYKIIQKFYSFKFYGEINFKDKILYSSKKKINKF
tara:strand:- start:29080 stop:29946 length:867 start_codon:yes stop_codon:yes gene_type:complete